MADNRLKQQSAAATHSPDQCDPSARGRPPKRGTIEFVSRLVSRRRSPLGAARPWPWHVPGGGHSPARHPIGVAAPESTRQNPSHSCGGRLGDGTPEALGRERGRHGGLGWRSRRWRQPRLGRRCRRSHRVSLTSHGVVGTHAMTWAWRHSWCELESTSVPAAV